MQQFGSGSGRIVLDDITVTLTDYFYNIERKPEVEKITHKAGDGTIQTLKKGNRDVYVIEILFITQSDWEDKFALLDGNTVFFSPKSNTELREYECDLYGFYHDNDDELDAVHIELTEKDLILSSNTIEQFGIIYDEWVGV